MKLDPSAIARLEEIGGPALVRGLIDLVLQELPSRVARIHEAVGRRDPGELGSAAHSLVSTTGNFGAFELADLARQTERSAPGADWPRLERLAAEIEVLAQEFLAHLAAERARRTSL